MQYSEKAEILLPNAGLELFFSAIIGERCEPTLGWLMNLRIAVHARMWFIYMGAVLKSDDAVKIYQTQLKI